LVEAERYSANSGATDFTVRQSPCNSNARGWLSVLTMRSIRPAAWIVAGESPGKFRVCDRGDPLGACVAVGGGRFQERAAGADHVVVDHHVLVFDAGADAGDLGPPAVDSPLVDERRIDAHVVRERLDPLGPSGVGAGEDEIVRYAAGELPAYDLASGGRDDLLAVEMHRANVSFEIIRQAFGVQIEQRIALPNTARPTLHQRAGSVGVVYFLAGG
jgi:hypothetical protein